MIIHVTNTCVFHSIERNDSNNSISLRKKKKKKEKSHRSFVAIKHIIESALKYFQTFIPFNESLFGNEY